MYQLLYLLRDVVALRRGPQDAPHSPRLLAEIAALLVALELTLAWLKGMSLRDVFAGALLSLVVTLGALHLLLALRGLRNRFVQSAIALVGCSFLFTAITLPFNLLIGDVPANAQQMTPTQLLIGFILLPIVVWQLVVNAHILRHSLDVSFSTALGIAGLWIVVILALATLGGPLVAT